MKLKNPAEGQLVISTQGRDKGQYYIVHAVCGERLSLVNGTTRKVANPKSKNVKHVRILPQEVSFPRNGAYENNVARAVKEASKKSQTAEE